MKEQEEIPVRNLSEALYLASNKGHIEVVRAILTNERSREIPVQGYDISSIARANFWAAVSGHAEVVREFQNYERVRELPVVGTYQYRLAEALDMAVLEKSDIETVRALLRFERASELPTALLQSFIRKANNDEVRKELSQFLKTRIISTVKVHAVLTTTIAAGILGVLGGLVYYRSRPSETS